MALRNISNSMKQPMFYEQIANNRLKNKLSLSISSTSSDSTDNDTNSAQIRTSSPISSSSSSHTDLFTQPPFNPIFKKKSPRKQVSKHVSIRELAYEKLKKQQQIEKIRQQQQQHQIPVNNVRSNGKLKIAAYNNVGHLTIHIIKGRSYRSSNLKQKESTNTYVKLNMIPDIESRFQQCQTMLVQHQQVNKQQQESINYDEKFSFELNNQNNLNNRLVISVWSRHTIPHQHINSLSSSASSISTSSSTSINNSNLIINDELIGCFSFKIKNLIKEPISAQWYHLLPEQQGLNKHFRCHRPQQHKSDNYEDIKQITNLNKDLIGMERLRIRVQRSSELESYGFTITGNCPCMVGKVDASKQAFMAGLRPGDYLSSINNKNVSRATCESVVKLIKSNRTNCLDIEVCREKKVINTVIAKPIQPQQTLINRQTISLYQFRQVQPQQQQQQHHLQQINTNLEVVIEEDENVSFEDEDNLIIKDDDLQQCCLNLDQIRHVDSSDLNTTDDELKVDTVEEMRRAAAKYYSNDHFNQQQQHQQQFIRQANIMSLKNLKIY